MTYHSTVEYRILYPTDGWVSEKKLLTGASDAIVNHGLDDYEAGDSESGPKWSDSKEPLSVLEAIEILDSITGEITIGKEKKIITDNPRLGTWTERWV